MAIYFDNAATTPILETALQAAIEAATGTYGNPASPHASGIAAEHAVQASRRIFADLLQCHPTEIFFTSGGTESNNIALLGTVRALSRRRQKEQNSTGCVGHIITTPYEHPSVLQPLRALAQEGFQVTMVKPSEWAAHINENTLLASCMHINNETGAVYATAALAAEVKRINPHTLVHVDGVQGFCKEPLSLRHVDLYAWSGHKINALKGVGGLMMRKSAVAAPLFLGGGQQEGLRPGTENTPGIASMTAAAQYLWAEREAHYQKVLQISAILQSLCDILPDTWVNINGCDEIPPNRSPYIVNISFMGVKGETLVHMLSERGIYVSMGAACRTHKKNDSPLALMGYAKDRIAAAVRFSLSGLNTLAEAETVREAVVDCVKSLRRLNAKRR